jgi:glycosyltransferase involved in cell wall biosynthesis
MRICHVTPHLPPEQAANALLPFHLGRWARPAGSEVRFITHPPRQEETWRLERVELPGEVVWVPTERSSSALRRRLRLDALADARAIIRLAGPVIDASDLVHIHSNGLLAEICAWLAARRRKPVVLTLYGTEIWHYRPRRPLDLFTRAYRQASHVTFYSQGLMRRAIELGLARREVSVIYPPVADEFLDEHRRLSALEARERLGLHCGHVIVNVKRLHPLAGQRHLIQAMGDVIRRFPDSRLIICGTGSELADLKAVARSSGVEGHVTFAGLVDNATVARYNMAADVFVLPSLLEACPTVALEALACGTPVVSSDNPGGVELHDLFGLDVAVVPRENVVALAEAIAAVLETRRRARPETVRTLRRDYTAEAVGARFSALYEKVLQGDPAVSDEAVST